MCNHHHGHTFTGQLPHHPQHIAHQFRIQRRCRLIEQHHLRVHRQRPSDRHALLLPPAELVRIGIGLGRQSELNGGSVQFGEQTVSFRDIAQAAFLHPERLPVGEDPALEANAVYQPGRSTGAFSYATHACTVAVDPGTGQVEVLDYVVCHDCGTMVNPMIVEAQVVGGVAQGLGTALYEEIPYDENGQPLASTFLDYIIPGFNEVPDVRVLHMETPSPHTRFGIKGMGEGGAIAPPAAVVNAINDALRPLGVEINETPATPDRILEKIVAAEGDY